MLLSEDKITEIYCLADDFCKFYSETAKTNALEEPGGKRHRNKPNRRSLPSVIFARFCCRDVACYVSMNLIIPIEMFRVSGQCLGWSLSKCRQEWVVNLTESVGVLFHCLWHIQRLPARF